MNLKKIKVMVSVWQGEILQSKVDPCAKCSQRERENLVICTKCGKWVHGRCVKMNRVTSTLAKSFVCEQSADTIKEIVEPSKEISFFDEVEFVKSFVIWKTG